MRRNYKDQRSYPYAERFMERGGIYGRSYVYPYRCYRMRRVLKVIRRQYDKSFCASGRWSSLNMKTFNEGPLVPMFAYEARPRGYWPKPPPAREPLPMPVEELAEILLPPLKKAA